MYEGCELVDAPVPSILGETVEVKRRIPRVRLGASSLMSYPKEHMFERTVEQVVDVPVLQIWGADGGGQHHPSEALCHRELKNDS